MPIETVYIDKVFHKMTKSKDVHEGILMVEESKDNQSHFLVYGGKGMDSQIILASITKLFTTACILKLNEQGKLSLNDRLTKYFNQEVLQGLHTYKGQDHTPNLTIAHLLFQTSGLPDAYEEKSVNLKKQVIHKDFYLSFDELLATTKQMKPHFLPEPVGKAYYADINFDLLGRIIEKVCQSSLEEAFKRLVYDPLNLKQTYIPQKESDSIPPIYFKQTKLHRPNYVMSCGASGGVVSTTRELMEFIKAFFQGRLFDKEVFQQLSSYNKLQASMYPIQYGGGYMRVPLEGLPTLFKGKGELLGHSGSTGSFAFYYPEKEIYIVGDLNQSSNPALPIRMAMRVAISV
ncbi:MULTISPECIES: serine hydrolase [Allobacillus]|uniref:Beta-lactamase family protein n=1 Tax=Allobacillus salarius TaxID=1955272 RepID=A0A556PKM3_9BACI|nr:serine hydrolase domain-containing protein [Allobacillus salarius]TSJ64944.1 beta-lactamase family protein [Allobacillus salarius]